MVKVQKSTAASTEFCEWPIDGKLHANCGRVSGASGTDAAEGLLNEAYGD